MPYAPEYAFSAFHSQLDSWFQIHTRASQSAPVQPRWAAAAAAYACAWATLGCHRRPLVDEPLPWLLFVLWFGFWSVFWLLF